MILDSCNQGYGNELLKEISYLINKNKQCIIPNKYSHGKIQNIHGQHGRGLPH